jgi:hypothetical protein
MRRSLALVNLPVAHGWADLSFCTVRAAYRGRVGLERTQRVAHVSPTLSIHSVRRVFHSTAGSQPFQINPSSGFSPLFGLSFALSSSPTYVQVFLSPFEAITLQWLRFQAAGCAHRPFTPQRLFCPPPLRYYDLIRQPRRLRFAWPWVARNGLGLATACVTFPSLPWLPCAHAATSTPPADGFHWLVHPSVLRAFLTGLRTGLTGSCHCNWLRVDPLSELLVFARLLRPVNSHGLLGQPPPGAAPDRPVLLRWSLPCARSPLRRVHYRYSAQPTIAEAGLSPAGLP